MPTPDFNFLIYKTAEEDITVNAVIRDETIWLTQRQWQNYSAYKHQPSANT